MFTDTHCHIDFEVFDNDRSQILSYCQSKNIHRIVVPSVKSANWPGTLKLCRENPMLIPALGLHPFFLSDHKESDLQLLESYCNKGALWAIGEIGLDFFLKGLDKQQQLFYFKSQLRLAKKHALPVLIHARKSHQDIIQLLKKHSPLKGIIHAFNGSEVQAKQYIELGFVLGFGGAFTNPRANHLRHLVSTLPLTSMVLETDAPDMLPFFAANKSTIEAHRQRNSPKNIIPIFKEITKLREETAPEIELQLEKNSLKIFSVEPLSGNL